MSWETTVNTGNPEYDRQTIEHYRQQASAAGMDLQVQPLPTGGFAIKGVPRSAPQANAWGAPPAQSPSPMGGGYGAQPPMGGGYGAPSQQAPQANAWGQQQAAYAGAGASSASYGMPSAVVVRGPGEESLDQPVTADRIAYLRKVYSLLAGACAIAIATGVACLSVGSETVTISGGGKIQLPLVIAAMAENPRLIGISFGVLFAMTFVASWTSKVKGLNVAMLFLVAALMGLQAAPMIFLAQMYAGAGMAMSATPVRDAFIMTGGVFGAVTLYVFTTKKDFSYLRAILFMGFWVVLAASILALALGSDVFSLAVASAGALLAAGFLLYQTFWIFKKSAMDDAVGDALVFLVQIRNLFMWILSILMRR
jgi:FtsH-binding integral membrane protein